MLALIGHRIVELRYKEFAASVLEIKSGPSVRIRALSWHLESDGGVDAVLFVIRPGIAKPDPEALNRIERSRKARIFYWDAGDPATGLDDAATRLAASVKSGG